MTFFFFVLLKDGFLNSFGARGHMVPCGVLAVVYFYRYVYNRRTALKRASAWRLLSFKLILGSLITRFLKYFNIKMLFKLNHDKSCKR